MPFARCWLTVPIPDTINLTERICDCCAFDEPCSAAVLGAINCCNSCGVVGCSVDGEIVAALCANTAAVGFC